MKTNRKIFAGIIVAAALAAAGSSVYAQPQGPGFGPGNCAHGAGPAAGSMGHGPHGMMGQGHDMMSAGAQRGGGHGMWSNPAAAVESYFAGLKVELKITPEQEKAWQAFTAKAKAQTDTMIARRVQMFAQTNAANQAAPERLAQRTENMKQGVAAMETMTAAVKDLYAVLTPEQKSVADQQLARGPMGGRGRHHRG